MLYSGTDPESYITEYACRTSPSILVYEEYKSGRGKDQEQRRTVPHSFSSYTSILGDT